MGVPTKFYTFVDGQNAAGLLNAARLNGNLDPLYACLNPAAGGLEDTNVKAGAKIVCSGRSYVGAAAISGTWEFTTFPTVPAASIPDAKLTANIPKKDAANIFSAKQTMNAGIDLEKSHAEDFCVEEVASLPVWAAADQGRLLFCTGDGKFYIGGASAWVAATPGLLSISQDGLAPQAPNDTTKFLRGDATWAVPPYAGYALPVLAGYFDPEDSTTYYFGGCATSLNNPNTAAAIRRMYIPKAGTIKVAYVCWNAPVTAGSGENISIYIRLNDTTDTLIATIGDTANTKVFSKTDLAIAVAQGDYIEMKMVTPAWTTNPLAVTLGGSVYIE